jgi:hypothetical protein
MELAPIFLSLAIVTGGPDGGTMLAPARDRPEIPRAQVKKDGQWEIISRKTDQVKR